MAVRRISVALGANDATVLTGGAEGTLSLPTTLASAADDPAPALLQLFARVEEALASTDAVEDAARGRVRVRVALIPPLCDVRLITLPPLRPEETDVVLRRDAGRHFLGSGRPLIVAGERFGGRGAPQAAPVFAAAASRALVEALQRAVEARGWELERIVPAHGAWLHALENAAAGGAPAAGSEAAAAHRAVIATDGATAYVLRTVSGTPDSIRRVPSDDAAAVLDALGTEGGRVLLLAEPETRAVLTQGLAQTGWSLLPAGEDTSARIAAARHAGEALPELVPTPLASARRERSRRSTVRMIAASIVTVAAAAVVHLLGTVREYRAVQHERAELRGSVAPALAARDSLDRINERLEELRAMGRASARWTFSLVEVSVLLPSETHLVSLRAAGDTAVIEAEGGRAGDALAALRTATTLRDVRIEGTIQREIEDGTASGERFTLSALLAPRSKSPEAPPKAPPAANGSEAP
jgi:hypothetical protein